MSQEQHRVIDPSLFRLVSHALDSGVALPISPFFVCQEITRVNAPMRARQMEWYCASFNELDEKRT